MTRVIVSALLLTALAAPARAQFAVVDHGNLAQAVLIAERTLRESYHSALRAAAAELANAGERLKDALAPPPFPEGEPQSPATSMPSTRRVM